MSADSRTRRSVLGGVCTAALVLGLAVIPVVQSPVASTQALAPAVKGSSAMGGGNTIVPATRGPNSAARAVAPPSPQGVVSSIPVGGAPWGVAYDSLNDYLYVSNYGSGNVTVINGATDKVVVPSIPTGGGFCIAIDTSNGFVYVPNFGGDSVTVINGATNEVVVPAIPVGTYPYCVAYDSWNNDIYVTNWLSNNVTVISGTTNKVVVPSIGVGPNPRGLGFDGSNGYVYVENYGTTASNQPVYNLSVIDGATNRVVVPSVPVGVDPQYGVTFDPANGDLYVSSGGDSDVAVINATTDAALPSVPVGGGPLGIAVDSSNGYVYVADDISDAVTAINGSTNAVADALIPVGSDPVGVAFDRSSGLVYVVNDGSDNVSVIAPPGSTHNVTFTESNLPAHTMWYVNISGEPSLSGTTSSLNVSLVDGHYTFTVGSGNKRWEAPAGSFTVSGAAVPVTVTFAKATYTVTFTAKFPAVSSQLKTLEKKGWTVVLNGTAEHNTGTTIRFSGVPNGTLPVLVTAPSGYTTTGSGTVVVKGATGVSVTIAKGKTVTLTFHEKGLKGVSWCVSLDGYQLCSTKASQKFVDLTPGTYSYGIGSVAGYTVTAKIGKGSITVPTGTVDLTKSTTAKLAYATSGG